MCFIRDIHAGEELTIAYVDLACSRDDRQKLLREKYLFACRCTRCSDADHAIDPHMDAVVGGDSVPQSMYAPSSHSEGIYKATANVDSVRNIPITSFCCCFYPLFFAYTQIGSYQAFSSVFSPCPRTSFCVSLHLLLELGLRYKFI